MVYPKKKVINWSFMMAYYITLMYTTYKNRIRNINTVSKLETHTLNNSREIEVNKLNQENLEPCV